MPHANPTPQAPLPALQGAAGQPRRAAVGRCARLTGVGAAVLVLVLLASAAAAPQAQALSIAGVDVNPLHWPGDLLGGLTGDIAGLAVKGFDAIIKALFAPIAKFITVQLIGWLVAVPDLTHGNVGALEQTVEAMAGGTLGAVATVSVIRYWAAGFTGGADSGFAALEGLARTVGAALFLAMWPWLFETSAKLTNLFTSSLLGSGAVVHDTAHLLAVGLGAGVGLQFTPVGLFVNIAMAVAASLLFLGLLLVKIVVSVSTILVFIAMPLAAVLWPVLPWVARMAARAFAVCLIVPVLWALCFAACSAVSLDALAFHGGSVINALLEPLVAIVLLWVMLRLPVALARMAMLGSISLGGGIVSRAVSYAAGSQLRDSAKAHLPTWAGGQNGQNGQNSTQAAQAATQAGSRSRTAATGGATAAAAGAAGTAAGVATAASAGHAASTGTGAGGDGRSYTPPPTAQANPSGQAQQNGLQTPSFAGREQDFANEAFEAQHRQQTSPVSAEQATAAMASLPRSTQRAVGQLVSEHGAGAREHLAYQAMGEWSPQEREALRTLAAATPEVRAQAASDVAGISNQGIDETSASTTPVSVGGTDERSRGPVPEPVDSPPAPEPSPTLARDQPSPVRGTDPHPPADSRPRDRQPTGTPPVSQPHTPPSPPSPPSPPAPPREPRGPGPDGPSANR